MKRIFLTFGLALSANVLLGQANQSALAKENQNLKKENETLKNSIKALKQDTTYLRNVANTCDLLSKSANSEVVNSNSRLKFELLSVKGDRASQTVQVDFFISHSLPNQSFDLHIGDGKPKAWDLLGSVYDLKNATFANNNAPAFSFGVIKVQVPTDVRVKGTLIFRNVLPSTEKFSLVQLKYFLYNSDGGYSNETQTIEIKNVGIKW